jgi:surface protein
MAKTSNPIQTTIKDFKNLFTKEGLKKISIDDLLLLKATLDYGNERLNELSEILSSASLGVSTNKNARNNYARNNTSYATGSIQPTIPSTPATELTQINSISNFDTSAVGLYDAEAEARAQNELFLQTVSEQMPDEVEVLEQIFGSIEDA